VIGNDITISIAPRWPVAAQRLEPIIAHSLFESVTV
jgi:hypothetical protein